MKNLFLGLLLFASVGANAASMSAKHAFEGLYWDKNRATIIQLSRTKDSIDGRTVWRKNGGGQVDVKNPDEELRSRPLVGMVFLQGFEYSARKNRWNNGSVYDPNNGKTYDAKLSLDKGGETLEMRGYIGISLFGRTAKFTRVEQGEIPAQLKTFLAAVK
ncbi:MAG: DUF2147 domain-containing protein [Kordiimonadaceae bacterium]|nr:DUF2147 domain-containing protein [Kordiimonadaceae bacterium]